jgi:phosphoribosylamine--glycine ligase
MTILLLGSGGREHAFAWKMIQSPLCDKLLLRRECWNAAIAMLNVATDFDAIKTFVLGKVEMVVVGLKILCKGNYDFSMKNESYPSYWSI